MDRFLEGCGAKGMYSYISTAGDPEDVHTIPVGLVGLWELRVDAMEMGSEMYIRVLQHRLSLILFTQMDSDGGVRFRATLSNRREGERR